MKIRLFLGLVFILLLPFAASVSGGSSSTVYAGHTLSGTFCQCGCPGCICDPEEQIELCLPEQTRDNQSDLGDEALFLGAALLVARRFIRK